MGCGGSSEAGAPSGGGGGGGGGGSRRDVNIGKLQRPNGWNSPFMQRHAPNGQTWAEYLAPVPPSVVQGKVSGAWAECVYSAMVFELTNPGWDQKPEYRDNGPVGYVTEFMTACGYDQSNAPLFDRAEETYRMQLQAPAQQGSRMFLKHKASNGQTWEEYLRKVPVHKGDNGLVNGAWGDAITSACIFEHENPAWDQLGPYSADGPAGQVIAFLQDCGHGQHEDALSKTEEVTHAAIDKGQRIPVYDCTVYQSPVQIANAPEVNGRPPRPSGRKKALLIGCNYPGSKAQLSGCVNDTHRWRQLLEQRFGFPQQDIVQLMDEGTSDYKFFPTRANFVAAVRWLVDGAQPGDVLFFQFSGHGGQQECLDGSEEDGMDEVLIPTDYKEAGTIVDHELFDLLVAPLPSGCKMTVILDCCHSGSALDLPWVWESDVQNWQCDRCPWHTAGDVQMYSGCEDSQCSMDVTRHGKAGGAMTTAACDVIESGQGLNSYPDFLNALQGKLQERGFDQRPRLSSSQPFPAGNKRFSLIDDIVPNLNPQLGQGQAPAAKPTRVNGQQQGFLW